MSEVQALTMPNQAQERKKDLRPRIIGGALLAVVLVLFALFWSRQTHTSQLALVDGMVYTVAPEATAPLKELIVHEGSRVRKGQVVAHMEAQSYADRLEEVERESPMQPPTVDEVDKRLRGAKAAEDEAIARLARVRHEEETQQKHMEDAVMAHVQSELRMRSIAASGGTLSSEYRNAVAAEAKARQHMEKAKEAFEASSRVRATLSQEVSRIRAEVQEAKRLASLNRYRARPAKAPVSRTAAAPVKTDVTAPVDGTVLKISAHPGDRVQAGEPLLLLIPEGNERSLWIKAWFPLDAQDTLEVGMKCTIERETDKFSVQGSLESLLTPEPLPKGHGQEGIDFLPVRIRLDDPSGLVPGDRVRCTITTGLFAS